MDCALLSRLAGHRINMSVVDLLQRRVALSLLSAPVGSTTCDLLLELSRRTTLIISVRVDALSLYRFGMLSDHILR